MGLGCSDLLELGPAFFMWHNSRNGSTPSEQFLSQNGDSSFLWRENTTDREILSHCTVKENHLLTVGTKFNSGYFFNSSSDMNRSVWTLSLQCQESALQNYATM